MLIGTAYKSSPKATTFSPEYKTLNLKLRDSCNRNAAKIQVANRKSE